MSVADRHRTPWRGPAAAAASRECRDNRKTSHLGLDHQGAASIAAGPLGAAQSSHRRGDGAAELNHCGCSGQQRPMAALPLQTSPILRPSFLRPGIDAQCGPAAHTGLTGGVACWSGASMRHIQGAASPLGAAGVHLPPPPPPAATNPRALAVVEPTQHCLQHAAAELHVHCFFSVSANWSQPQQRSQPRASGTPCRKAPQQRPDSQPLSHLAIVPVMSTNVQCVGRITFMSACIRHLLLEQSRIGIKNRGGNGTLATPSGQNWGRCGSKEREQRPLWGKRGKQRVSRDGHRAVPAQQHAAQCCRGKRRWGGNMRGERGC